MTALSDQQQIQQVCRQQITGMLTKDIDLLDQIISPTATFIHLTGEQQSKSDWLRQIKNGRMQYFNCQEISLDVEVTDQTATAEMRNLIEARIYGFRNTWSLAATMTLAKDQQHWQIVRSQASLF